jgi:hypothetical protein
MKYFLKKYKSLLAIIVFISIVLPLFYFSFTFMLRRIQAKADLIQTRIIDNNLEKAKIGKIPEMEKANAEFETNKDAVGTILAFSSKVEFIKYVEALAEESHNKIELKVLDDNKLGSSVTAKTKTKTTVKKEDSSEDPSKKSIEDSLLYKQYISMQVDLEGDYAGFLNFIHKLENNKYYVNIVSFNLQKGFTEKEEAAGDGGSSVSKIFSVPVSQSGNPGGSSDGYPVLRSSLNIIIYTE